MWAVIDELNKKPKERRKKIVERVESKRQSNSTTIQSTASKKDRDRRSTLQDDMHSGTNTLTYKNVQDSHRNSKDMAKQIHQHDVLVEKPTTNRHSSSSSIILRHENDAPASKVSKKPTNPPIQMKTRKDPNTLDEKKQKTNKNRESVDKAMQSRQSGLYDEKSATSGVIVFQSLVPPQQHNIAETSDLPKKSNKIPTLIDYEKEPSMLIKHKTQRVDNIQDRVEQTEKQNGNGNVKVTPEPQPKPNKAYFDNLKQSDLGDPHSFEHTSGYSLLESEWRSGNKHNMERSEKTREYFEPQIVQQQEVVEKTASKIKKEKRVKVKRGDLSEPISPQHIGGFSKLGVSLDKFDVDNFLPNKELLWQLGLQDIPEERSYSDRSENSNREKNLEKVVETPELTKNQQVIPTQLKISVVSDSIEFEHNSEETYVAGAYERTLNDIEEQEESTVQLKEEIYEARSENVTKVKKSAKKKTGKLKMSEISDPVSFEHVSGYTKVDDNSENELSDHTSWSDDGGLTDDDTYDQKEKNGLQKFNEKIHTPEKEVKEKRVAVKRGELSGPFAIEHVSGFSKLGVSIENFDVVRYAENTENFTQSVLEETSIKKVEEKPVHRNTENLNAFPTHNSDYALLLTEGNKLLTPDTKVISSKHIKPNHDAKRLKIRDVQVNKQKENMKPIKADGVSDSVNYNFFGNYTEECGEKNDNKYCPRSEKHEMNLDIGNATNVTYNINVQTVKHNDKEFSKGEKEIVKNDNFSDPVDFQHIDGFSKLGVPIESFDVNSYVEKKLNSGESEAILNNNKLTTKNQESKKQKKGKLKKEELGDPVNFKHVLGYSKDQGSGNDEWSDEDIKLCSENTALESEGYTKMEGQGSGSSFGDVTLVTAKSTANEPQENGEERQLELIPLTLNNKKLTTETQKPKKNKTGKLKKKELDEGSGNEDSSDEHITLSGENNHLEHEGYTNIIGQGSISSFGDVTLDISKSTVTEPHENGNEKQLELLPLTPPPPYFMTPSIIPENSDRNLEGITDQGLGQTKIHQDVPIPDKLIFKSFRKHKGQTKVRRKKKFKKEDIGQPQNMRHTYGHSKRNFPTGCQTFDKITLEKEYQESLVQAINSDIKGLDNKVRLFIQHVTLKSEDLSQNNSEDDITSERGAYFEPRQSIESASLSDASKKPKLNTIGSENFENESENNENICDVLQIQKEELRLGEEPTLEMFQQIRQGRALKSVSISRNKEVHETLDHKETISNVNVNQIKKEKDKTDSLPREENTDPELKNTPANRKITKTIKEGSSAGPMAMLMGKRSQAFRPSDSEFSDSESEDSELEDNLSEGETRI